MEFRLLLDLEVLAFLQGLKSAPRRRLLALFDRMQDSPHRFSDFIDRDEAGRRLDVCVFEGVAVFYWVDTADRHIKVLKILHADGLGG